MSQCKVLASLDKDVLHFALGCVLALGLQQNYTQLDN